MSKLRLLVPILLVALAPRVSRAQSPAVTPERQAAIMEAGRLMNSPVEFVLQFRKELALTAAQVASLEKLGSALRDSSAARSAYQVRQAKQKAETPALASMMAWDGAVDEVGIREAMVQQSSSMADMMIAGARDRRLVGALLTAEQRAQLPQLYMSEMVKAARAGGN